MAAAQSYLPLDCYLISDKMILIGRMSAQVPMNMSKKPAVVLM